MDSPLVSVIIPTYNRPHFLVKTLQSITGQTYKNMEIIVVSNQFSGDNRSAALSLNDQRIKYFEQENSGGPASPRNHGIRVSKGKFVAFCDDDDLWMPDKIEKQVKALKENAECGLCYTKMLRFDETHEWAVANEEGAATLESLLYKNVVPISSLVIRRELLDRWGGFCESRAVGTAEDYEFVLRMAVKTKFLYISEYLIKYWSGEARATPLDSERTFGKAWDYFCFVSFCYWNQVRNKHLSLVKIVKPLVFQAFFMLKILAFIMKQNLMPTQKTL